VARLVIASYLESGTISMSMVGQTIKVLAELVRGGMGVVYKAEDTKLERTVALKFLAPHLLEDEEGRARFIREAKAAAALDHPNICTVHEIDEIEGETFIAMAYVEGQSVKQKIKSRPLKLEEALDIAIQTAQGLKAAHQKEIVHRDIKPANLMLTGEGQLKVMDFGLAQLAERSRLTKTATILGTPAYMSPEQAQRQPTDRRADIWSLGVVIYEMVTGKSPFEGEREHAVLYAIANEDPEPITALRAGLPMELELIVGKALAKDKEERYRHVEEMIVDLRGLSKKLASGKSILLRPQPTAAPIRATIRGAGPKAEATSPAGAARCHCRSRAGARVALFSPSAAGDAPSAPPQIRLYPAGRHQRWGWTAPQCRHLTQRKAHRHYRAGRKPPVDPRPRSRGITAPGGHRRSRRSLLVAWQ